MMDKINLYEEIKEFLEDINAKTYEEYLQEAENLLALDRDDKLDDLIEVIYNMLIYKMKEYLIEYNIENVNHYSSIYCGYGTDSLIEWVKNEIEDYKRINKIWKGKENMENYMVELDDTGILLTDDGKINKNYLNKEFAIFEDRTIGYVFGTYKDTPLSDKGELIPRVSFEYVNIDKVPYEINTSARKTTGIIFTAKNLEEILMELEKLSGEDSEYKRYIIKQVFAFYDYLSL